MASIKKDGNVWRVQIKKGKDRDSGSFPTKGAATAWAAKREAELAAGKAGKAPPGMTVGGLLDEYAQKVTPKKKGERWETNKIKFLQRDPMASLLIENLSPKDMADWRDRRRREVSDASVLREWTLLTHVFKVAITEWRWMSENPMKHLERPPEAQPRRRLPTADEIDRISAELGYSPDASPETTSARVGAAMHFAIATAMRAGEICKLKWENVDTERRIARMPRGESGMADTKTGAARDVPLSSAALHVIAQLEKVRAGPMVFQVTGGTLDTLFRRAKVKQGIDGLHFHDFRAEALTRIAKKVDVLSLARISGHADINMLMIYYRETAEQLAPRLD